MDPTFVKLLTDLPMLGLVLYIWAETRKERKELVEETKVERRELVESNRNERREWTAMLLQRDDDWRKAIISITAENLADHRECMSSRREDMTTLAKTMVELRVALDKLAEATAGKVMSNLELAAALREAQGK